MMHYMILNVEKIRDGSNADVTVDQYHRYKVLPPSYIK